MDVVITGVAGFLGSHLAKCHIERGDEVWGVDNFSSSDSESAHFKALLASDRFHFAQLDVCDDLVHEWLPGSRMTTIYSFACPASPPRYQQIPIETMMTCVAGTRNVLELARRTGARVVHASTSEVYGDPSCSPQSESYRGSVNSYGPRACYDEGKRAAEALCFDYLNKHRVDARLVRIFNTYGPHMQADDGRVVSNFICQALRGEPLTVYGDGSQTRSFCYVDDLVRGIVYLAERGLNPRCPINLGNPHEFTVKQLAEKVVHKTGGALRVEFKGLPKDDPTQRCPDTRLARELLGWEPRVTLDEGLDRTISYFRRVLS